jgi:alcohol dehydrogenase class IV
MPARFEFATAGRILFGPGTLRDFQPATFGKRAFICGGRSHKRLAPLLEVLTKAGVEHAEFEVATEPTLELVSSAVEAARAHQPDFIIGMGGGSVIDAAKATAALLNNPGPILDYLEVIGQGKPLTQAPVPMVAIPTTAGAGAEVTRNAVITSHQHQVKVSLRSPLMLPRLAIVDPELTLDLPPELTASTGMDALTQLIEPYVSARANPMTDLICISGIHLAALALPLAYKNPADLAARSDMSLASLYGGMALANAGLGAVHGFAAAIGGMFHAPHGAICARLLEPVMRANIDAVKKAQPKTLHRYTHIGQLLARKPDATAEQGVACVHDLCASLKIPHLGAYGISEKHLEEICARASAASSMKANPVTLPIPVLRGILTEAL